MIGISSNRLQILEFGQLNFGDNILIFNTYFMIKRFYKEIIIIGIILCIYFIISYYILEYSYSLIFTLGGGIFIGLLFLSIVVNFFVFGERKKAKIKDYSLGFGGSTNMSNGGRGRKYLLIIFNKEYKINYASLSSYEKGTIVTVYIKKNNKVILLKDLIILLFFGLFWLQLPIRYILGLV